MLQRFIAIRSVEDTERIIGVFSARIQILSFIAIRSVEDTESRALDPMIYPRRRLIAIRSVEDTERTPLTAPRMAGNTVSLQFDPLRILKVDPPGRR